METYWSYINLGANVARVEDIPVMVSSDYLGECVNGFKCTGAFFHKPTREDLQSHLRSYVGKVVRNTLK